MRLLQLTKEAGRSATLTFVVKGGKTRAKLEIDLDSERAPPSSSTPAAPAPRPRRRRRRQARGASQQGAPSGSPPPSFQEGEAGGSPQPPQRPLKHLAAAPDGRQVLLQVGRPAAMLSFASLNTDGPPPSLPPRPPPPPPPALQTVSTLKLRRLFEVEFNNISFKCRIAVLSTYVGVERFRWHHREPLWPGTPPWHSSSSPSSSSCSSSPSSRSPRP